MHRLTSPTALAFQSFSPLSVSVTRSSTTAAAVAPFIPLTQSRSLITTAARRRTASTTVTCAPQATSSPATSLASTTSATASAPKAAPPAERDDVTVVPRSDDYSAWYQSVISAADLAESAPVRGCLVIKPHGYAIWERLRDTLDARIKATGVSNAYFPLLIPQSFLSREAQHVDGFAKECAVVTHHRLSVAPQEEAENSEEQEELQLEKVKLQPDPSAKLDDPLVVRPTSETIIWHMFSKWVTSYRDLPLLINQWANVVRWEMRTRPFLRTTEFLWQEGHTAHATAAEANARARQMLALYADVVRDMLALPVVTGVKSPSERFAGAVETFTIEAQMQNGWALQAGTSHDLGDNFPRAFDVTYTDDAGKPCYAYGTSWGVTTRLIGALIMTHSDDTGLVLPPSVAPIQVVLVLIFKNEQQKETVLKLAEAVETRLSSAAVRVQVDARAGMRPGAKYYEWERKGVPLRLEIGPKDAAKQAVFAARRTHPAPATEKKQKVSIPVDDNFEEAVLTLLDDIQTDMYDTACMRLERGTRRVESYEVMRDALARNGEQPGIVVPDISAQDHDQQEEQQAGFFLVPWKCDADNERTIREETKATLRCYPLDGQEEAQGKTCFYSGEPATHMAIFARAY